MPRYRVAVDFAPKDPKVSISDPKKFSPTDAHLAALADGVMIGIAYMLIQSGISKASDIAKWDVGSILRSIPKMLQKLTGKGQFFRDEMMKIKNKGPDQYLKQVGGKLRSL